MPDLREQLSENKIIWQTAKLEDEALLILCFCPLPFLYSVPLTHINTGSEAVSL